ncbi:MAG: FecR domain-containing protein [Leptospiraceae bacterium]|nr:FecR domain-containing protein [Leptospiraceae bacterium]MCK6380879.1 FecR domain-containing protein [Leptospiraceae bacterium]
MNIEDKDFQEFSEIERLVFRSVIQNEENELSESIRSIQKKITKEKQKSISIPENFSAILQNKKTKNTFYILNFKNMAIGLGAAAMIAIAVKYSWFQNEGKPQQVFSAKVTFLTGEVYLKSSATKDFVKLENGSEIYENQTIITKGQSKVDIWLSVGTSIRIKENSEVVLKKLIQGEDNTAELYTEKGKLFAHVHKNQKKSNFQIVSPTAIAGVRGTKFYFESDMNKSGNTVKVGVQEGRVALSIVQNQVKVEPVGEQVIEPGQKIEMSLEGFKRSRLTQTEKSEFSEIDTIFIDKVAKKRITGPLTETQLKEEYDKLEKIILDDNTVIRGVIIDMDDSSMLIHTTKGEIRIDRTKVIEVSNLN